MLLSKVVPFLSVLALANADTDQSVSDDDLRSIQSFQSTNFGTTFGSTCACTILTGLFWGKVLFPGSAAYQNEATYYWDEKEALSPKCIFVPTSANDVAKGVVALKICQSQFAVRGGGHMPIKGAANTDEGVLLALSGLKSNVISADQKTVKSGSGQGWFSVYTALAPYGLYAIGGRLKTIGVGGLTLGGGINYFANKYGFTMDTVVAYEVVVASGQVLTATATSNADLFWALKGGGNNFGIVTSFTYSIYKIPNVSTAIVSYSEDQMPSFTTAIANLAKYQTTDLVGGAFFTLEYVPSTAVVTTTLVGIQTGTVSPPPVFANFTTIPNLFSSYNVTTPLYWHSTLDSPYQTARRLFGVRSMIPDPAAMLEMVATYKAAVDTIADVPGLDCLLVFQPIPTSIATVAKTNGVGNALGTDNATPFIWWQVNAFWSNASDDDKVIAWASAIREKLHAANAAKGLATNNMYMNDAGGDQKVFSSYPSANLARLKTVRAKYDPTLVFRNLVTGGFKLD